MRIENGVPAIVDKDTFYKVQRLLVENQRAPAAKWTKADYLFTGKLFCGTCGTQMVGECGTSKSGGKYNYYLCLNHKRGGDCKRKAVRQDLIEPYVLKKTQEMITNDEVLDYIVENVWNFYERQDQQRGKIKTLEAQLRDAESAVNNLTRAIEAGMPLMETTKNRLSELDAQITAINAALAQIHLESGFKLQKDHIRFFLEQFRAMDYSDRKCQQRLIDVFVNSIYVADDELVLNFNFGGDKATLRFPQFKAAQEAGVFGRRAFVSAIKRGYELVFYENVFALILQMPRRI